MARPGRRPISPDKGALVVLLLNAGVFSDREIARRLRIHPWTVAEIRKGCERVSSDGYVIVLRPGEFALDEPRRCPRCGQRVTIFPCRLCGGCPRPKFDTVTAPRPAENGPPAKRRARKARQLSLLDGFKFPGAKSR